MSFVYHPCIVVSCESSSARWQCRLRECAACAARLRNVKSQPDLFGRPCAQRAQLEHNHAYPRVHGCEFHRGRDFHRAKREKAKGLPDCARARLLWRQGAARRGEARRGEGRVEKVRGKRQCDEAHRFFLRRSSCARATCTRARILRSRILQSSGFSRKRKAPFLRDRGTSSRSRPRDFFPSDYRAGLINKRPNGNRDNYPATLMRTCNPTKNRSPSPGTLTRVRFRIDREPSAP